MNPDLLPVSNTGPVNTHIITYLSIIFSFALFIFIVNLVRKRKLREEYSLLWIFFSIVFIIFSLWRQGLEVFAHLIGIAYAPAALFLTLVMAMFFILIQYSIIISKLTEMNKNLVQEVGILKNDIDQLKTEINKKNS